MAKNIYRIKLALLVMLFITSIGGAALTIYLQSRLGDGGLVFTNIQPDEGTVLRQVSYISGAVNKPGVYEVSVGQTRIAELIEKAGGLAAAADTGYVAEKLNLAQLVEDEQHIFIPLKQVEQEVVSGQQAQPADGTASASSTSAAKVNINTATSDQLDLLPGVGPSTAENIIASRPFTKLEQLLDVPGIGESKFNQLKDLVIL